MQTTGNKKRLRQTARLKKLSGYTPVLFNLDGVVQFIVHQYPSAVLANDDLLALTDLTLTLRRNSIETSAAGIPQYRHHGQTIAIIAADPVIGMKQPGLHLLTRFLRQLREMPLFFFSSSDDLIQLILLILQHRFLRTDVLLRLLQQL